MTPSRRKLLAIPKTNDEWLKYRKLVLQNRTKNQKKEEECLLLLKSPLRGGLYLKAVRKKYSWSQKQMADLFDVSTMYISTIERGKAPMPPHLASHLFEVFELGGDFIEAIQQDYAQTNDPVLTELFQKKNSGRKPPRAMFAVKWNPASSGSGPMKKRSVRKFNH